MGIFREEAKRWSHYKKYFDSGTRSGKGPETEIGTVTETETGTGTGIETFPPPDRPAGPDRIAGLISYEKQWEGENNAYISFVVVNPVFRNMGLASELITLLEEQMRSEGMERMYVCTWSTNRSALALYGNKGFSTAQVIEDDRGPLVNTVYLVKDIVWEVRSFIFFTRLCEIFATWCHIKVGKIPIIENLQ